RSLFTPEVSRVSMPSGMGAVQSGEPLRQSAGCDDSLLRALVRAVAAETGESFFRSLVRHLASALEVEYSFVSELTQAGTHFRTHAFWKRSRLGENFENPVVGTPCEAVLRGEVAHYSERLQELFPADHSLADWGAVSYAGVPM